MNYPRTLVVLGLLIIIVPFLGVPLLWKHILTIGLGMLVIGITILLRSSLRTRAATKSVRPKTAPRPARARRVAHHARALSETFEEVPIVPTITSESLVDHDEA